MKQRLWLGTSGEVTCTEHAGSYLKAAIETNPAASTHETPLDWYVIYSAPVFPCETCVPWNTRGKKSVNA